QFFKGEITCGRDAADTARGRASEELLYGGLMMKTMADGGSADARRDLQAEEAAGKSRNSGKPGEIGEGVKGGPAGAGGQDTAGEKREEDKGLEEGQDERREDPAVRLAELEKEKEELIQRWLRLRADFENYRRRSREELQRAREQAL